MIGVNEIRSVTKEIESNATTPSILGTPDSYIIPGLNEPVGIPSEPQGAYDQINQFFSKQDKQNKTITEAREILGESAKDLTDEQVYDLTNEIQYLVDSWLEEYEKEVFDGKTLDELIKI